MNKKIVFITGGAKGIGAKTAELFLQQGYDVIIHYHTSKDIAENLKKRLEQRCLGKVYLLQGDLSIEAEVNKVVSSIRQITNHLDVLVNNASLSLDEDVSLKTKEEFMKVLDVNLYVPFALAKNLSNILKDGVVINISSTDGIDTGNIYNIDYSTSKAGLNVLTQLLASAFLDIRFYALAPNWVETESVLEMEPEFLNKELKRIGQARLLRSQEVAEKIMEIVNNQDLISGSIVRMDGNE